MDDTEMTQGMMETRCAGGFDVYHREGRCVKKIGFETQAKIPWMYQFV
jgi:hypothetical protein